MFIILMYNIIYNIDNNIFNYNIEWSLIVSKFSLLLWSYKLYYLLLNRNWFINLLNRII